MVKLKTENGEYLFKLDDILRKQNISINKLMRVSNINEVKVEN